MLTETHDVYTTGLGQHGQLGHGDEDSKRVFTWVKKLGGKRITAVYAGGHHTWCVIEGETKQVANWQPPSPLRNSTISSPMNASQAKTRDLRDQSPDTSVLKERRGKNDIGLENLTLHVIFSDQQKSHRFVRVTIDDKAMNAFNRHFGDYVKRLEDEEGGLAFYNI